MKTKYMKYYKPADGKLADGLEQHMFDHAPLVFVAQDDQQIVCFWQSSSNGDKYEVGWKNLKVLPGGCKKTTRRYFEECTGFHRE